MIDAKFKWELADNTSSATVDNLEKELGISRILATLLANNKPHPATKNNPTPHE